MAVPVTPQQAFVSQQQAWFGGGMSTASLLLLLPCSFHIVCVCGSCLFPGSLGPPHCSQRSEKGKFVSIPTHNYNTNLAIWWRGARHHRPRRDKIGSGLTLSRTIWADSDSDWLDPSFSIIRGHIYEVWSDGRSTDPARLHHHYI